MLSGDRAWRLWPPPPPTEGRSRVSCGLLGSGGGGGSWACGPRGPLCQLRASPPASVCPGPAGREPPCRAPPGAESSAAALAGAVRRDVLGSLAAPCTARGVLSTRGLRPVSCTQAARGHAVPLCLAWPRCGASLGPRVTMSGCEGDFLPGLHATAPPGVPDVGCMPQSWVPASLACFPSVLRRAPAGSARDGVLAAPVVTRARVLSEAAVAGGDLRGLGAWVLGAAGLGT